MINEIPAKKQQMGPIEPVQSRNFSELLNDVSNNVPVEFDRYFNLGKMLAQQPNSIQHVERYLHVGIGECCDMILSETRNVTKEEREHVKQVFKAQVKTFEAISSMYNIPALNDIRSQEKVFFFLLGLGIALIRKGNDDQTR